MIPSVELKNEPGLTSEPIYESIKTDDVAFDYADYLQYNDKKAENEINMEFTPTPEPICKISATSPSDSRNADYSSDNSIIESEKDSPLTIYFRENEKREKMKRNYFATSKAMPVETPKPIVTPSSQKPQYVYYADARNERKAPYDNRRVQAKIIDRSKNRIIYVQNNKYLSAELKFSFTGNPVYLIERKEDGFWYLNEAISQRFDLFLNGRRKSGSDMLPLTNGDTINLCAVNPKSLKEYFGKTYEYQVFFDNLEM